MAFISLSPSALPPPQHITDTIIQMPKPVVGITDMAKLRAGFAIRCLNEDTPEDQSLPKILLNHNQAVLDYFFTVQEEADKLMDGGMFLPFPSITIHAHFHHFTTKSFFPHTLIL